MKIFAIVIYLVAMGYLAHVSYDFLQKVQHKLNNIQHDNFLDENY